MGRTLLLSSLLVALLTPIAPSIAAAGESPQENASWWLAQYGAIDTGSPIARRAREVFDRVAAVADQRGTSLPRLVLLDKPDDPFAAALPDGSVLLTRGGLALCYGKRPARMGEGLSQRGDARLAFVLGHELTHLAHDSYWHAFAVPAITSGSGGERTDELRETENRADSYGLLYMELAGFDPGLLFEKGGGSFFERWVGQVEARGFAGDRTHRPPKKRARAVERQLEETAKELPLFHFGVRLYELGRYDDAIVLLEGFGRNFPGREVANALGLAHYQRAAAALARCDGRLVERFRLPLVLDPETLAERARRRGSGPSPCLENETFQEESTVAKSYFKRAGESDAAYLPARLNLVATLLLRAEAAPAFSAATEASDLAPDDPRVAAYHSVAFYLFGQESGTDTADQALDNLEKALEAHPEAAPYLLFDRARILAERKRMAAAEKAWHDALAADPHSSWGAVVRERLGLADPPPRDPCEARAEPAPPPLPLGPLGRAGRGAIRSWQKRQIDLGPFHGNAYEGEGGRALAIGSTIEVVERDLENGPGVEDLLGVFGPPERRVPTLRGEVLVYDGVAWEIENGREITQIWFAPGSRKGEAGCR